MEITNFYAGIRDISKISNERLFLCQSGDELRSVNDRCNRLPDCEDQSDENNCLHCKKTQRFIAMYFLYRMFNEKYSYAVTRSLQML